MFILIPSVIIFLALAYLELSEEITIIDKSLVSIIIVLTLYFSFKLYKGVKQNFKQQEINMILMEIKELEKKLKKETDEQAQDMIKRKIDVLKKDMEQI